MSIYLLKPRFQALLRPLVNRLASGGVTANQVTVFAMLGSIAIGIGLAMSPQTGPLWLALPLFLFFRMALNAVDGMLAREHAQQSRLGGLLNEMGDVVSDIALYLPFALLPGVHPELVVGAVILAGLTEFAGVLAPTIGATRRYDGPMGKSDRAALFGAAGLALGCGAPAGTWLDVLFSLTSLLMLLTTWRRLQRALQDNPA